MRVGARRRRGWTESTERARCAAAVVEEADEESGRHALFPAFRSDSFSEDGQDEGAGPPTILDSRSMALDDEDATADGSGSAAAEGGLGLGFPGKETGEGAEGLGDALILHGIMRLGELASWCGMAPAPFGRYREEEDNAFMENPLAPFPVFNLSMAAA